MPAKRRMAKRRLSRAAELEAWSMTFQSGCDFLGDLARLGLAGDACFDAAARERACEAWERLGAAHMAGLRPEPVPQAPWALEAFGAPPGWSDAG